MSESKMGGHKDQAEAITSYKKEVDRGHEYEFGRNFVNAGAPSHGVMGGEDMKNANDEHVEKVTTVGEHYKGYSAKAWKY